MHVPNGRIIQYNDIVCIDERWEEEFAVFPPKGMIGESIISLIVGDKKIEIGKFRVTLYWKTKPNLLR